MRSIFDNFKFFILSIIIISSLFFLVSCSKTIEKDTAGNNPIEKDPKLSCQTDIDCVPSACCHPSKALNKDYAPNCSGILCTQECVPDTLDCGQGEIKCIDNECIVIINK